MDIRLLLMTGADIPIPECQITVHQPTIFEISMIGEESFFIGAQTLCITKSMIDARGYDMENVTNFQVFSMIMGEKQFAEKRQHTLTVLQLLCPGYQITLTPRALLFNLNGQTFIIDESNFESFQGVLNQIFCLSGAAKQAFNPANDKAKEIAEKLMRGRQRVAAQKGDSNSSLFTQYLSILTVGLQSMSLHDLKNCTMFQIYDLMERYSLFINWDIDIRSRLAGGKPDKQPDNWMKSIH